MRNIVEEAEKMQLSAEQLKDNYQTVEDKIAQACRQAGRNPQDVRLIAVSKKKPVRDIETLQELGQTSFGENYVQELMEKYSQLPETTAWHMIGHLQRNKVKYLIGKTVMIHSVDSLALAEEIDRQAAKADTTMNILLEVNVAEEDTKFGFKAEDVPAIAGEISRLCHIRLCGLMTSAPKSDDPEANRPYFEQLRRLRDRLEIEIPDAPVHELSMGMTQDYEAAIKEGATMVRIGTAIFGARDY